MKQTIHSMTGYGFAEHSNGQIDLSVELRSFNHKHLNVKINCSDSLSDREHDFEKMLRERVQRGSIQIFIKFKVRLNQPRFRMNREVIAGYLQDLESLQQQYPDLGAARLSDVLSLPNVLEDIKEEKDSAANFQLTAPVFQDALNQLVAMREAEGGQLGNHVRSVLKNIREQIDSVRIRAPHVVAEYRDKLSVRIQQLLDGQEVKEQDLMRELSVFADRADISEEIARLDSHLLQVDATLQLEGVKGRKLEFLTQEMLREANTIGAKANDLEISRVVVGLKTSIEQVREQILNVE